MPRTASTTKTDRIAPRTSTKFREERVTDQVPVLFRLPLVDCLPVPTVASEPMFATAELQPEWVPTPAVAPPLPIQPAQPAQPIQPIQPPQPKPATAVVSSSTREVEPAYVQAVAAVQPFAAASQPSLKTDTDSGRSWWEHWSSGVVLILLIIALVTASILAFNDSGSTDPSLLAELGDKPIETLDLNIPELAPPQVSLPDATAQKPQPTAPPGGAPLLGANRTNRDVPADDRAASASSSLIPSDLIASELEFESQATGTDVSLGSNQSATAEATSSQPTLRPLASLVAEQTESSPASREAPAGAALLAPSTPSTATTSALASATLSPPIGMDLPPLFPNGEVSSGDAPTAGNFSPDSSTSRSSAAGSSTAVQSPAVTDGALTLPSGLLEQPALSSLGSSTPPIASSLIETNLPSYQAMLIGSSASASGGPSLIPDEGAFTPAPAATPSEAPATTGMPSTETPELSTEAIIRAWQMHKAVNQAQASPSNRYVAPSATNPGGSMSYTLGGAASTANPSVPGTSGTGTGPPTNPTLPRF